MMNKSSLKAMILVALAIALLGAWACEVQPPNPSSGSPPSSPGTGSSNSNSAVPAPADSATTSSIDASVTLPMLDAFLSDSSSTSELKSKLQLNDQEMSRVKAISREANEKLRNAGRENGGGEKIASDLRTRAESDINAAIGAERTRQLFAMVSERPNGKADEAKASTVPNAVPTDTRIVVNTPAFRMDVFENGQLKKSYKVGIGYPEFPLPTGMRKAETIIFNPTWTPPDESWVEVPGSKAEVGKTVPAGDRLNPLGLLKVPIGQPSLIHGGKSPAKIGTFASHGCVGLTDPQVKDFAKVLAGMGGTELTDDQIAQYQKNRSETKNVKLAHPIPVDLRYETIVVEGGKLHIYRDVYGHGTNTEQNLRSVLEANGVNFEKLAPHERAMAMSALEQMSRDATGKPAAPENSAKKTASKAGDARATKVSVTRAIKGQKEVVVEIAELNATGYPAPVDLDTGTGNRAKANKVKAASPRKK